MTHSNISTKAEADFLEKTRKTPDPQLTLTPGGSVQFQVDYDQQRMADRRIEFIRMRLRKASASMNQSREKAIAPAR